MAVVSNQLSCYYFHMVNSVTCMIVIIVLDLLCVITAQRIVAFSLHWNFLTNYDVILHTPLYENEKNEIDPLILKHSSTLLKTAKEKRGL